MSSLFKSTNNTRQLIKGDSRFIRSDVPVSLTAEETQWLIDEDVLTVIDLREGSEQPAKSCPLKYDKRFEYLSMPVTGGNAVPDTAEGVIRSYIQMCDEKMQRIIDKAFHSSSSVLFFCNAGKDRTGVVSALLLYTLGYDDEYIINDYMLSADNLKDVLAEYAQANNDIDIDIITPHEEYIKGFLEWYKQNRA